MEGRFGAARARRKLWHDNSAGRRYASGMAAGKKLFLFDIDGTLLLTGRAGEHALRLGLKERFGIEDDLSVISFAGSTDGAIARQMFGAHDIPVTPENLADLFDGYVHHLAHELPQREGRVLPGIVELLDALHARRIACWAAQGTSRRAPS